MYRIKHEEVRCDKM
jgi:Mg2+ and Co2+ transporter CorA